MITPGGFQPTSRCTYKPGGVTGDYVRFAPITAKFVRQRRMSRWATKGLWFAGCYRLRARREDVPLARQTLQLVSPAV